MASPQRIREWLRKMEYPDPNPSDEALQTLCRGPMGPIFQQIIDRVKPKQEIVCTRKTIIVNKIQDDKLKYVSKKTQQPENNIEKVKLHDEKRKLEKQLHKINAQNIENEATLEHLKSKVKSKSAKYHITKEKMREYEKDILLFKVKIENLKKQIENCQKLYEQSKVLERTKNIEVDFIPDKIAETLAKLYDIISSYKSQLSVTTSDLTTISENSMIGALQTSLILSSNKKPLSSIKKANRANSTRKNLAEITNNYSIMSSTLRKKNLSKLSFITSFSSTLSPTHSFIADKNTEAMKELEQLCWNNQSLMNLINGLWESDCEQIFKVLIDLKESHKNKIVELIAQDESKSKNYDEKSISGIEKLYAFHVEREMKRMICQQEQKKIQVMLDTINFEEDIRDITVLKATECSLRSAIDHARSCIMKLQYDLPDNSEKLDQILEEIQGVQNETVDTKTKIESNLCIMKECSSWLEKHRKNIFENIRKPQLYSEYELLKSDIAEQDAQNFVTCPIQSQQTHYFNNWVKVYNNPELLEIIQYPHLSPENALKLYFNKKNWVHQLQLLKKETNNDNLNKVLGLINVVYDDKKLENSYKKSVEQLKISAFSSSETLKRLNELDIELKYYLESSLNECLVPNVKYNSKTLKDYCELYDSYFKQL